MILLVDDDELLRPLMAENIRRGGYEVFSVGSGGEAVELATKEKFELILCDIVMGDMEGYDVLSHLFERKIVPQVPFAFLSGKIDEEMIREAQKRGAVGYLKKPVKKKDLLDFVGQVLIRASP